MAGPLWGEGVSTRAAAMFMSDPSDVFGGEGRRKQKTSISPIADLTFVAYRAGQCEKNGVGIVSNGANQPHKVTTQSFVVISSLDLAK